jgi:hypothetical protein
MENISHKSGYTFKAFFIGSVFAAALAAGAPYGNMVLRGSYLTQDFSTPGAFFLFFVLVGVLNAPLKLLSPTLGLNRAELIVVYSMMLIASAITTCGLSEYLLPIMTSWHYFATPENQWAELFHPYIREFMVPYDPQAIKYFYEGLPAGGTVPWRVWALPLLCWSALVLVVYFVMICMAVILRRQWIEREKLLYPLAQLPLEMVHEVDQRRLPAFFKSLPMWIGFAVPFLISTTNAFHNYFHVFPTVQLADHISLFRHTVNLPVTISFPVLGFAFLINLDIAFGLWFFNILSNLQRGAYGLWGLTQHETLDTYSIDPAPIAHQGMGALIVLVFFSLWVGREHLRRVGRKAFLGDEKVDDSDEILSYRTAVWGLLGGLLFIGVWLYISGIPVFAVVLFLLAALIIFTGMSRIVAESGVPEARTPMMPQSFVVSGVGTEALGQQGLTALGFTFSWATELRIVVMSSCAHSLKLIAGLPGRHRLFFWVLMVAVLVSMVSSMGAILALSYRYGGINLNQWFFGGGARAPFETFVARRLLNPIGPDWDGWLSTGVGAGVMAMLMLCRHHFAWWPLHPIGYPISGLWLMSHSWFSIFLAWLCKWVVLKYWGPRGYRAVRPFFLGVILGQFVSAGLWLVIDACTGMTDNRIFSW